MVAEEEQCHLIQSTGNRRRTIVKPWDVACFRKDSSNLARCYIEAVRAIREYVAARDSGESQKGWRQLQEIAGAAND